MEHFEKQMYIADLQYALLRLLLGQSIHCDVIHSPGPVIPAGVLLVHE